MPTDIWSQLYTRWLRLAGATIGEGAFVHHRVKIWVPENIEIGRGVQVPSSADMAGMGKIKIGDYTLLGSNVSFITNNHPIEDDSLSWQEVVTGTQQSIHIGAFCWLMNDTRIIAGTTGLHIGDYSWLAAGSTATKDIPAAELWGGSPAAFIRSIHPRSTGRKSNALSK